MKSVFTYYLICLNFRHCQELSESRDIIAGLLYQFEDLSGINSDLLLLLSSHKCVSLTVQARTNLIYRIGVKFELSCIILYSENHFCPLV